MGIYSVFGQSAFFKSNQQMLEHPSNPKRNSSPAFRRVRIQFHFQNHDLPVFFTVFFSLYMFCRLGADLGAEHPGWGSGSGSVE